MAHAAAEVVLWLFVVNLGVAFGAGLYEARILVPQWLRFEPGSGYRWDADAARRANAGIRFWAYVTTGPLTFLTLGSLGVAWWTSGAVRHCWLAAAAISAVERVMTFGYFVPTMVALMRGELAAERAVTTALSWVNRGYARQCAILAAWLAALKALSLVNS
jgi:hypothetical protein